MPSRPTDSDCHSRFIVIWTMELEIGTKGNVSVHWLTEERFQSENYYKPIENDLKTPQQYHEVYSEQHHIYQDVPNQYFLS
jgi:hypothetical protein